MSSVEKNNKKRIRPKPGDVLEINFSEQNHSYAHVSNIGSLVIFYDYKGQEQLSLDEIILLPIAFRVWVYSDVLKSGRWPRVGNIKSDILFENPQFYKQDHITGTLSIYHDDYADTNYERPASLSQIEGLERAAVWDAQHVEDRLECYFKGEECKWLTPLDDDLIPDWQRK